MFFKKISISLNPTSVLALVSMLLGALLISPAQAMEDFEASEVKIGAHLWLDATHIQECLSGIEEAELHFFWTTGQNPTALKPEYGASKNVDVGGAEYSSKFPPSLDALLSYSPKKLSIKFVCDTLTLNSNQDWIQSLEVKYGGRFETLDIQDVQKKVTEYLPCFASPIDIVFQNGIEGNPAITSDLYRLLGMVYGATAKHHNIEKKLFTYCDIDTFCHGLEHQDYKDLIAALFTPSSLPLHVQGDRAINVSRFMKCHDIGTEYKNNLIKIQIRSPGAYDIFCRRILEKLNRNLDHKKLHILNYFPTLHQHIVGLENKSSDFADYIETFQASEICVWKDIIETTGPGLLRGISLGDHEQYYPDTHANAWHGAQLIQVNVCPLEMVTPSCLNSRHDASKRLYDQLLDLKGRVDQQFKTYSARVTDAFFARRFGENHPFYQELASWLMNNFPYKTHEFKLYFQYAYMLYKTDPNNNSNFDEWLKKEFYKLSGGSNAHGELTENTSFSLRLTHTLQKLGINRPLTPGDMDYRDFAGAQLSVTYFVE